VHGHTSRYTRTVRLINSAEIEGGKCRLNIIANSPAYLTASKRRLVIEVNRQCSWGNILCITDFFSKYCRGQAGSCLTAGLIRGLQHFKIERQPLGVISLVLASTTNARLISDSAL
jgi:hypothetical protein